MTWRRRAVVILNGVIRVDTLTGEVISEQTWGKAEWFLFCFVLCFFAPKYLEEVKTAFYWGRKGGERSSSGSGEWQLEGSRWSEDPSTGPAFCLPTQEPSVAWQSTPSSIRQHLPGLYSPASSGSPAHSHLIFPCLHLRILDYVLSSPILKLKKKSKNSK